jgi:hypothetical protein
MDYFSFSKNLKGVLSIDKKGEKIRRFRGSWKEFRGRVFLFVYVGFWVTCIRINYIILDLICVGIYESFWN